MLADRNVRPTGFSLVVFLSMLLICLVGSGLWCGEAHGEEPAHSDFRYARELFEEGYFDLAAEQLERCLRDYPGMVDADEAQYLLGEAYLCAGEPEQARAAYLRAAIVYPRSPWAPEALFKVGVALEAAGRPVEAAQAYERVHGFYPEDRHTPKGLQRAAELYELAGDAVRSESAIDLLIEKYPDSEATDAARLIKAGLLMVRGDRAEARHYLERIAARSGIDTMAAAALVELGRLLRGGCELDAAAEAYQKSIEQYPGTRQAALAKLELADLMNFRGLTGDAIRILAPMLAVSDSALAAQARIEVGDAYYRRGEFEQALKFYDSVSSEAVNRGGLTAGLFSQARLKAAWTAEVMGNLDGAFDRYLRLAGAGVRESDSALLRAAVLAGRLERWEQSAALWAEVLERKKGYDPSGRILFELAQARLRAGLPVGGVMDSIRQDSPWLDEVAYLIFIEALNSALEKGTPAAVQPERFFWRCPASPLLDSAQVEADFALRHRYRSERLMERMAELSARAHGSVSPARWALDWGDFYLDEFKDPDKAVEQFDLVIRDDKSSGEDRSYALERSIRAYLLLLEGALRDEKLTSAGAYADSAHHRLDRLVEQAPDAVAILPLSADLLRYELTASEGDSSGTAAAIEYGRAMLAEFGPGRMSFPALTAYIEAELTSGGHDSTGLMKLVDLAEAGVQQSPDDRTLARLKLFEVRALAAAGSGDAAVDSAERLNGSLPETPAGAEAELWLIENPGVSTQRRCELLEDFRSRYPYLMDVERTARLAAELLELSGQPLEALAARERADAAAGWGQPQLDILDAPDEASRFSRGRTFREAGQLDRAAEEFRIVLNLDPSGERAPAALMALAGIRHHLQEPAEALACLDSLASRFPEAVEMAEGRRLRPELLMTLGEYGDARALWLTLSGKETAPDSALHYAVQAVVCLYRQGRLEEARVSAKELYSRFKERDDLDRVKALFYLEKGRTLDRAHRYEDARRQYGVVARSYALTPWADAAAYAAALSMLSQGLLDEGAEALERLIEDFPQSELLGDALLSLGLARYRAQKYPDAAVALRRIWEDESARAHWGSAYDALIATYKDLRFWDAAIRLTRDYLERFPEAPDAIDRRMDIGWFYLQLGEWDEAVRYYRPLLPMADAEREAEIQYYIGEAYFGKGDYRTAILEFLKVKILGRKTRLDWGVTALYKAGNSYEKLGDKEGAGRMYRRIIAEMGQDSNYGIAARKRLDEVMRDER